MWLSITSWVLVSACADESPAPVAGSSVCERSGGHCLGHNAPSAKGQGPATCEQLGTWFYGGPLRPSPMSCEGEPKPSGGNIECCVR